jgi:hypothetical protein
MRSVVALAGASMPAARREARGESEPAARVRLLPLLMATCVTRVTDSTEPS